MKEKRYKGCKGEGWVLIRCLPRGQRTSIVQCKHCEGTGKSNANGGNLGGQNE